MLHRSYCTTFLIVFFNPAFVSCGNDLIVYLKEIMIGHIKFAIKSLTIHLAHVCMGIRRMLNLCLDILDTVYRL